MNILDHTLCNIEGVEKSIESEWGRNNRTGRSMDRIKPQTCRIQEHRRIFSSGFLWEEGAPKMFQLINPLPSYYTRSLLWFTHSRRRRRRRTPLFISPTVIRALFLLSVLIELSDIYSKRRRRPFAEICAPAHGMRGSLINFGTIFFLHPFHNSRLILFNSHYLVLGDFEGRTKINIGIRFPVFPFNVIKTVLKLLFATVIYVTLTSN